MEFFKTITIRSIDLLIQTTIILLTARYYGADGRGYIAAGVSIASIIGGAGGLSLGKVAIRILTKRDLDIATFFREKFATLMLLALVLAIVSVCVATALYVLTPSFFGGLPRNITLIFIVLIPYYVWITYSTYLFSIGNKILIHNKIIIYFRTFYISGALLLVVILGSPIKYFIVLMAVVFYAQMATEITLLIRIFKPKLSWDGKAAIDLLADGGLLHVDTVGGYLLGAANIVVLNYYLQPQSVGIYQFALQMIALLGVIGMVGQLFAFADIAKYGVDDCWPRYKRIIAVSMAFLIAGAAVAYFVFPLVLEPLGLEEFEPSVPIFRLLLIAAFGQSLALLMGPQWVGRGLLKTMAGLTSITGLGAIILSLYLVPRMGIFGAAYAYFGSYVLAAVANTVFIIYLESRSRQGKREFL